MMEPRAPSGSGTVMAAVALLTAMSMLALRPASTTERTVSAVQDGASTPLPDQTGGLPHVDSPASGASGVPTSSASQLECRAGANGGKTARGVTGDRIRLASTNVRSGPGSSFLGSSYIGMQAVARRVNAGGGVCGRLIDLFLIDDGWDAVRGAGFIRNFAAGDYFALPVVPSSEGLTLAIKDRTLQKARMPVIGSDGMLKEQYADPWVWPVATATVSTMRIMALYAQKKGACRFGIVFDSRYRFGKEGADAFHRFAKTLPCVDVVASVGIEPARPDYSSEINAFNERCNPCDFVAMLLEPGTAFTWVAGQPEGKGFGKMITAGAQPLFNERFARDCGRRCGGMLVWTGFNPPVGRNAAKPDVARYVREVRAVDPGVDVNSQFLEGAYLGMEVFVEALRRVGPDLTPERLRDVMNSMRFTSGLSGALRWAPKQRFASCSAQAYRIVTASGSFAGFGEVGTGFIRDPLCGEVS